MDPISIVSGVLSGIAATYQLVEIGCKIYGVKEDAPTFISLLEQVQKDLEHALNCRKDTIDSFRSLPQHYRSWIMSTIKGTIHALDDFGKFVLKGGKISTKQRFEYVLRNKAKLEDREKVLRFAHSAMLGAINFMHMVFMRQLELHILPPSQVPTVFNSLIGPAPMGQYPSAVTESSFYGSPLESRGADSLDQLLKKLEGYRLTHHVQRAMKMQ